ncbi:MAG: hypothetical protein GEU88_19840 [Solirubrobacterales bacterium]|nr:hypothetical protein [Solirubrobacterales bacterium]
MAAVFYCTAKSSPRCVRRWGRADRALEAGGPCHPCRRETSRSRVGAEEVVGTLLHHVLLGGLGGAEELAELADSEPQAD